MRKSTRLATAVASAAAMIALGYGAVQGVRARWRGYGWGHPQAAERPEAGRSAGPVRPARGPRRVPASSGPPRLGVRPDQDLPDRQHLERGREDR